MKSLLISNRGVTLIYILAAFLIVMFIGQTMIKASYHDVSSSSDFISSQSAVIAAKSGIEATRSFIENDPSSKEILKILNEYIRNRKPQKLLPLDGDVQSINNLTGFSSRLLNFAFDKNSDDFTITIESTGFGVGGSQKKCLCVLDLSNIDWLKDLDPSEIPVHALQADNGAFEFNTEFTVDGDVAIFKGVSMNVGPFLFNGKFKVFPDRITGSSKGVTGNASGTFNDTAYMGVYYRTGGSQTFNNVAAFNDRYDFTQNPIFLGDTTYFNLGSTKEKYEPVNLNNKNVVANIDAKFAGKSIETPEYISMRSFFTEYKSLNKAEFNSNLMKRIGIGEVPKEIYFDISKPLSHEFKVEKSGKITTDWLNKKYEEQKSAGELWNDKFLVVYSNLSTNIVKGTNEFSGKAILIMNSDCTIRSVKTTSSANLVLYLNKVRDNNNRFAGVSYWRGFIYINKASSNYCVFKSANYTNYVGAIYASPSAKIKIDGKEGVETHTRITFDENVIEELAVTNIFTKPDPEIIISDEIVLIDPSSGIGTKQLARQL